MSAQSWRNVLCAACLISGTARSYADNSAHKSAAAASVTSKQPSQGSHEMTFRWPVPGVVYVTETVEKKGKLAEFAYELHICKANPGAKIHYQNIRLISWAGFSGDNKLVQALVEPLLAFKNATPVLWINDDGSLIDLIGIDKMIHLIVDSIPSPKLRSMLEKLSDNPRIVDLLKAKTADIWASWVGLWAPFDLRGEPIQSFAFESKLPSESSEERHSC